jgi:hypothetical protein
MCIALARSGSVRCPRQPAGSTTYRQRCTLCNVHDVQCAMCNMHIPCIASARRSWPPNVGRVAALPLGAVRAVPRRAEASCSAGSTGAREDESRFMLAHLPSRSNGRVRYQPKVFEGMLHVPTNLG